jgi:hypothetical protein
MNLMAQLNPSYMTMEEGGANSFDVCLPIEDVVIGFYTLPSH